MKLNETNGNLYWRRPSRWCGTVVRGRVFDGTRQMYWAHVTQEWCEPCQLLTHTPSQSAASATSLLIVRLLWGIRLDSLSREQQNQLNGEIRCINKQCSAWGRPGMTQWHSHLDITLQLPPPEQSAPSDTDTLASLMTIYVHLHGESPGVFHRDLFFFKMARRFLHRFILLL